jgi:cytochrome c-type biogenesis protein CcmE
MLGLRVRWKKIVFIVSVVAGALFLTLFVVDRATLSYIREGDFQTDTVQRTEREIEQPVVLYGMTVNHLHVTEDLVRRDQRFVDT